MLIGLPAVFENILLILGLLGVKRGSKFAGTYLLSKKWIDESAGVFSALLFRYRPDGRVDNCDFGKGSWIHQPDTIFSNAYCRNSSECGGSNPYSKEVCSKENITLEEKNHM